MKKRLAKKKRNPKISGNLLGIIFLIFGLLSIVLGVFILIQQLTSINIQLSPENCTFDWEFFLEVELLTIALTVALTAGIFWITKKFYYINFITIGKK